MLAAIFIFLELVVGVAFLAIGLEIYLLTLLAFCLIWVASVLHLPIYRASNSYILRQDGLEVRRGIVGVNSFVVTRSGFGDLLLYQSLGGRIFGYGTLIINSQGERQTKLFLVHDPFKIADLVRDVMGKPIVRIEN